MVALLSLLVLFIAAASQLTTIDHYPMIIIIVSILFLIDTTALPLMTVLSTHHTTTEHPSYSDWIAIYHHNYTIHASWIVASSLLLSIILSMLKDTYPSPYLRNMVIYYLLVYLFVLLSATTWIVAQHFSLAMLIIYTTIPTAIVLYMMTVWLDHKKIDSRSIADHCMDKCIVEGPGQLGDSTRDGLSNQIKALFPYYLYHRRSYYLALLMLYMVRTSHYNKSAGDNVLTIFMRVYLCIDLDHLHSQPLWVGSCRLNSLKYLCSQVSLATYSKTSVLIHIYPSIHLFIYHDHT